MAYDRPSLSELLRRIRADIENNTEGSAFLRRSFENVLARVLAGLAHGLYGYLGWVSRQILPSTCDEEYLLLWGAALKVPRKAPQRWIGLVQFTGTNGTTLPLGTGLQSPDGTLYATSEEDDVALGVVVVEVQASDTGSASNLETGAELRLTATVPGINSIGTVTSQVQAGDDLEDLEDYRVRVVEALGIQAMGGIEEDYVRWVRSTAGVDVDRVWVTPRLYGSATVGVAFSVVQSRVLPTPLEQAQVQAVLDANKPVDLIAATAWTPAAHELNVVATITPTPDADLTAAIEAELVAMVRRDAQPDGTILLSHIREAISAATGEDDHVLTSPTADVVPPAGHMVVFSPDDGYGSLTLS